MNAIRQYAAMHGDLTRCEAAEAQALFNVLYSMEAARVGEHRVPGVPYLYLSTISFLTYTMVNHSRKYWKIIGILIHYRYD